VRLSRAAYYRPLVVASRRDAVVIAALTDAVAWYSRWGFWKLFVDRDAPRDGSRITSTSIGSIARGG
jgi:hypothetical protein